MKKEGKNKIPPISFEYDDVRVYIKKIQILQYNLNITVLVHFFFYQSSQRRSRLPLSVCSIPFITVFGQASEKLK